MDVESRAIDMPRPNAVTEANWDDRLHQGVVWISNLTWPLDCETDYAEPRLTTPHEYLAELRAQYGPDNLLLGHPANDEGRPDSAFAPHDAVLIGVYAKRG